MIRYENRDFWWVADEEFRGWPSQGFERHFRESQVSLANEPGREAAAWMVKYGPTEARQMLTRAVNLAWARARSRRRKVVDLTEVLPDGTRAGRVRVGSGDPFGDFFEAFQPKENRPKKKPSQVAEELTKRWGPLRIPEPPPGRLVQELAALGSAAALFLPGNGLAAHQQHFVETGGGDEWAPGDVGGPKEFLGQNLERLSGVTDADIRLGWSCVEGKVVPICRPVSLLGFLWLHVAALSRARFCQVLDCGTAITASDPRVRYCKKHRGSSAARQAVARVRRNGNGFT